MDVSLGLSVVELPSFQYWAVCPEGAPFHAHTYFFHCLRTCVRALWLWLWWSETGQGFVAVLPCYVDRACLF